MAYGFFTPDHLKQQARRLRDYLAGCNIEISHARSLEALARQYGHKDWNVLAALSKRQQPQDDWPEIGAAVTGTYLGQDFTGTVVKQHLSDQPGMRTYSLRFDSPVDVVTSDRFSAYRRQVMATLNPQGISVDNKGRPNGILVLK